MIYEFISFNIQTGQLAISYKGGTPYLIDIPIENGTYLTGEALDAYLKGFIPAWQSERESSLRDNVLGADYILSRCRKPDNTPKELSYFEKRVMSYPAMTEYLDAVVKDDKAAMEAYIARCLEVKAMYPKPETTIVSDEVLKARREL